MLEIQSDAIVWTRPSAGSTEVLIVAGAAREFRPPIRALPNFRIHTSIDIGPGSAALNADFCVDASLLLRFRLAFLARLQMAHLILVEPLSRNFSVVGRLSVGHRVAVVHWKRRCNGHAEKAQQNDREFHC